MTTAQDSPCTMPSILACLVFSGLSGTCDLKGFVALMLSTECSEDLQQELADVLAAKGLREEVGSGNSASSWAVGPQELPMRCFHTPSCSERSIVVLTITQA